MEPQNRWADAQRLESWAGEVRLNLIRLVAILVFYGNHLVSIYLLRDDPASAGDYHTGATLIVFAWASAVLALYFCLSRRWMPPWLRYAATPWDTLLITALLVLSRDPKTTMPTLYFLVIAAAALRLSLPLVQAATLGTMAAYAFYLGYLKYYLEVPSEERLPRVQQIIFLLALGAAGILAGQVVRQVRRLIQGYPVVVEQSQEGQP